MIQIVVMYADKSTEVFRCQSFQQGSVALSLNLDKGGTIAIPVQNIKAYQVDKIDEEADQATQPDDAVEVTGSAETEGSEEQEERDTEKEEV